MATRTNNNRTYYINPAYLTFNENSGYEANLIQVSASSSCWISVYDKANGIGYSDADKNYQRWKVTAYNNKFPDNAAYRIYVRLERNGTSALIVYSKKVYNVDGSSADTEASADYYYIYIGDVSATDGTSVRSITYDTGYLESDQGYEDANELNEMWELDKYNTPWLVKAKQWLHSFTVKGFISLIGGLIFKTENEEKVITDIKRSTDNDESVPVSDETLPTTKYISNIIEDLDDRFLRKDQDDRTEHSLGVGGDLEVDGKVSTKGTVYADKGFEAGNFETGATGAACYQDKDGNWHIETDHLKVRKRAEFTEVDIQTTYHVGGQQMSTAASMRVGYVLEMEDVYRCYFLKKDSDGREVWNQWRLKDQAYCNTFNLSKQQDGSLGNHYLWRLVTATSNETKDNASTRVFGDVTIQTSDYHFVDLSKSICAENSDAPQPSDKIVLLGHQGNDRNRQGCIVVAGAGEGSPYIYEFTGITSFVLPEPETKIKPGDNRFTGVMRIQGGSTGIANLEDFPEEVAKAVQIGAVNLLRNSGFTGDYKTEEVEDMSVMNNGSELFSKSLKYWEGSAKVNDDDASVSGRSAVVGNISQSVQLMKGENYVVSFRAKGKEVSVSLGDEVETQTLSNTLTKYTFRFSSDGIGTFSISGDATVCDLQLERGTMATDWKPSPLDNDKTLAEFQALKYIQDAILEGDTDIIGGLILSSMIQLGNYKDGKMEKVSAGMSGIYNDDNSVAFWGGGTFKQAIKTILKFRENPHYRPTEEEWAEMANFVVSHGGDAVFRGSIFADNGYFRGEVHAEKGFFRGQVHAESGVFKNVSSPNGAFEIDDEGNVMISGEFNSSHGKNRVRISPSENKIELQTTYNGEYVTIGSMSFVQGGESWDYSEIQLVRFQTGKDENGNDRIVEMNRMRVAPTQVELYAPLENISSTYTPYSSEHHATIGENGYDIRTGLVKVLDSSGSVVAPTVVGWRANLQCDCWPTSADSVGVGGVYNDGGVLKVKQ